jgi:propionyl-CoA carboxylase beta chain
VKLYFKKEISEAQDPVAKLIEKETEYAEKFATPYRAAQRGFIDEVIIPRDTRKKLLKAFSMLNIKKWNCRNENTEIFHYRDDFQR